MASKGDFPQDALAQLIAKHPLLFHNQTPYASHVPVGWLPLADALCTDLEMILGDRCNQFEVRQVKASKPNSVRKSSFTERTM
jgi:hypothetical protein